MKSSQVAYGVRVKLNDEFEDKCIGDKFLRTEKVLFLSEEKSYNDSIGEYVMLRGGSLTCGGYAYLNQLDLEYPVPHSPLYEL